MSIADVALIDSHCHGVRTDDLADDAFRALATESDWLSLPGTETLDSPVGIAIRARCASLLDLERHAPIERYLERRRELGAPEVNRRLMTAGRYGGFLIDTGYGAEDVLDPDGMAGSFDARSWEIVRLERVAESIAPVTTADGFAADFRAALASAGERAVGFKSIMAYRAGLDLPATPPPASEVRLAAEAWLRRDGASGSYRIDHPVLLAHLVWAAVEHRKPIQFHIGFGDSDVRLDRSDPSRLTAFLRATRTSGASIMLLHCYPFIREAGALAHIFPHVHLDVGEVSHYTGPSAIATVRESLEIAPFTKVLFSSDAYGLPELYYVSASSWRAAMTRITNEWLAEDWLSVADAERLVELVAAGNARRVYGLEAA